MQKNPIYGLFGIDPDTELYPGYTFGDSWNGWATPHFTKEVAERVCALAYSTGAYGGYDEAQDAFVGVLEGVSPEDIDVWPGQDIVVDGQTVHVYPVGAWDWCWDSYQDFYEEQEIHHCPACNRYFIASTTQGTCPGCEQPMQYPRYLRGVVDHHKTPFTVYALPYPGTDPISLEVGCPCCEFGQRHGYENPQATITLR